MQKSVSVIYDYSEDTKIREEARLREKSLHDEVSALKAARVEGENLMIARMKAAGMSDAEIKRIIEVNL